jgi:hypothetical protein
MRSLVKAIVVIFLVVLPGCDRSYVETEGYLEGTITIGPLCPVEREPPDSACLPTAETFNAYPVGIWTVDGRQKIEQIRPSLNGSFRIALLPGYYLIVLEKDTGAIGSSNLPAEILIMSEQTTFMNINIDTGIR